jgi:dihydrofolate synthase/folylpolyglutamate synthase
LATFTTLADWLTWQEQLHPQAIDLGLERVGRVWARLRPAGLGLPAVVVAGTNGKGSCVALLESILQAAGYRTGCYTSPHLLRYHERIRLDGTPVEDTALCAAFARVEAARAGESLTYFEFGTLAALDLCAGAGLDLALLEVGLGGRLDAVNLVSAEVALITSIGLDHCAWLGEDPDSIAREKAGIGRPGRPLVIGQGDAPALLDTLGAELGAPVWRAGRDFGWRRDESFWSWWGPGTRRHGLPRPALRAARQLDNAAAVLMVLQCLGERFPVDQAAVRAGLLGVRLAGRLQVLPGTPEWVLDVAHNQPAMAALAADLGALPPVRTEVVFACLADKDAAGMAAALAPRVTAWHLPALTGPRARVPADLARELAAAGIAGPLHCYDTPAAALAGARDGGAGRVLVTGSFLTVAAALDAGIGAVPA